MAEPVIFDTARRHGVSDAEIKHALDNAWTVVPDQGDWDLEMYLGPAQMDSLTRLESPTTMKVV